MAEVKENKTILTDKELETTAGGAVDEEKKLKQEIFAEPEMEVAHLDSKSDITLPGGVCDCDKYGECSGGGFGGGVH